MQIYSRFEFISDPECYRDPKGVDYQGHVSITSTGKICQKWSSDTPHKHSNTDLGDHNFCRNSNDTKAGPWCYTTDPGTPWEYCDVAAPNKTCNAFGKLNAESGSELN